MIGCPVGAIRRKDTLEIVIENTCVGCDRCAKQCPYGNINMVKLTELGLDPELQPNPVKAVNKKQQKATTCDLCVDVRGEPACVKACPHDAAHRVVPVTFFREGLFRVESGQPLRCCCSIERSAAGRWRPRCSSSAGSRSTCASARTARAPLPRAGTRPASCSAGWAPRAWRQARCSR
jgi:ferredoxin